MDAIIVLCTFATREDALRIGSALVEERFAACINILPPMQSIYRWKGQIEDSEEILALFKTTQERFVSLRNRIKELHPYETPEIIVVPVIEGLAGYLAWIREQVS